MPIIPPSTRLALATLLTVFSIAGCGGGATIGAGPSVRPASADATEGGWPIEPVARICGNTALLEGPASPPAGAIVVPAGDNSGFDFRQPGKTYWFEPGVHTLGDDVFGQIIPGDDATFIGGPGAILDGRNRNRFAFTQHARNVTIKHLTIRNFGRGTDNNDEGVVNHDAGENWTITHNTIIDNDGAGVFIGSGNVVAYNCLKNNGQYGASSYHPDGIRDIVLDHNEIVGNNTDDWERLREGCGCTGGVKFWDVHGAVVTNNWVHDNRGTGLWADYNNSTFRFEGNTIENNDGTGLFYEISYNFVIRGNTFKRNALVSGKRKSEAGDPFPFGAIYISESGGDARAGAMYAQSEIAGNYFENNWDGIVLWENADRFCRPGEAFDTTNNCPFFEEPPTWGSRYKTQNITIRDNVFRVDRNAIGCTNNLCARMALFSNYGSYPPNSPYLGTVIQNAVTFSQNNRWMNNAYHGPWRFMPFDMGRNISFSAWQASPYGQDAGSSFDGEMGDPSTPPPLPSDPPSPPTAPPAAFAANFLNADTATLENSVGRWTSWYSATAVSSAEQFHGGARSLKIEVTEPYGWGVQFSNYPGFGATAGSKQVSLWSRVGTGAVTQPTLTIKWLDAAQQLLHTETLALPAQGEGWQRTRATVQAPRGTATVLVYLTGSGSAGSTLYVDDVVVGDVDNTLDFDTASLENGVGQWQSWYSAAVARATNEAYSGAGSLRVDVAAQWGWGVQLGNWPGFAAQPGAKRISYRAKAGTAQASDVTLRVKWMDAAQQVLQTDLVSASGLSAEWQLVSQDTIAPPGTAAMRLEFIGRSGGPGDALYLDEVIVTDVENVLDADTASLETSLGRWTPWYSASVARSAEAARSGGYGMQVGITQAWGWGVQLSNWPGYAVTPGKKRLTVWARRGAGSVATVTLRVRWFDAGSALMQTDAVTANLTDQWAAHGAELSAPAGAAWAWLEIASPGGAVGDAVYLDGIVLAGSDR